MSGSSNSNESSAAYDTLVKCCENSSIRNIALILLLIRNSPQENILYLIPNELLGLILQKLQPYYRTVDTELIKNCTNDHTLICRTPS